VHHGCGTNLWKRAGDRPPKVELGAPTLGVANKPLRHVVSPNCSGLLFKGSVAQARVRGSQKCRWLAKLENVSVAHRVSLLGGEVKALNTSRNAALLFHAITDFSTIGSETG
jgi:hypothetical protein